MNDAVDGDVEHYDDAEADDIADHGNDNARANNDIMLFQGLRITMTMI